MSKKVKEVKKGRPVNPNSARQLRLKELEEKRKNGTLKRGRPVVEGSARQLRLAELEAKKANNGGVMPLGHPKSKVEQVEVVKNENGELEIVAS